MEAHMFEILVVIALPLLATLFCLVIAINAIA